MTGRGWDENKVIWMGRITFTGLFEPNKYIVRKDWTHEGYLECDRTPGWQDVGKNIHIYGPSEISIYRPKTYIIRIWLN